MLYQRSTFVKKFEAEIREFLMAQHNSEIRMVIRSKARCPWATSKTSQWPNADLECGIQAESFNPDCIIVDFSIGKVEALQICQNLRKNIGFSETILIALLPDDGNPMSFDRSAINETFKKPFDARLLAERLRTLIGAKKELV